MATNLQIKFIRSLQLKKNRDENKLFICEGSKIIEELLLQANYKICEIYAKKSWIEKNPTISVPIIETNDIEMQKISSLTTAPEVLALVHYKEFESIDIHAKISLYLDNIADPGNMGTILRTSEWFGITQIYISPQCVHVYNPKVVQATMGSLFRLNINVISLSDLIKKNSFKNIYGAVLDGENINKINFEPHSLIVMGSESHGISTENLNLLTHKILIPKYGNAESLNVSVATGIILDRIASKLY